MLGQRHGLPAEPFRLDALAPVRVEERLRLAPDGLRQDVVGVPELASPRGERLSLRVPALGAEHPAE